MFFHVFNAFFQAKNVFSENLHFTVCENRGHSGLYENQQIQISPEIDVFKHEDVPESLLANPEVFWCR